MPDFLERLVSDAKKRVGAGYYDVPQSIQHEPVSLRKAIEAARGNAIIAEIKPCSPSLGPIRPGLDAVDAATRLTRGGAVALSVLTEPDNFGGSLDNLRKIRQCTQVPLLMKDIIIDQRQIQAGRRAGADCVLLIASAFQNNEASSIDHLIQSAHDIQLEVLLEVHSCEELDLASRSGADITGINNRNLSTLKVDLDTTTKLLGRVRRRSGKPTISESGFESAADIRKLKQVTVNGFLIGSSIMLSDDMESKVREFVLA